MKIVVFGSTGGCGRHVVRLAYERGHDVTAVARAESPLDVPESVRVVRGDVLDAAFVCDCVAGHDAVVSALGMRYAHPWASRMSPDDFTSRATANIVAAMQAHGVRRVIVVSAAGVGDSRPAMNFPMRCLLRTSNVGVAYADLERVESCLAATELEWEAVRPTTLSNRKRAEKVRRTGQYGVTASIAREDVALYMVRELESPAFAERTPMITG